MEHDLENISKELHDRDAKDSRNNNGGTSEKSALESKINF